jgi:hypothetical protein
VKAVGAALDEHAFDLEQRSFRSGGRLSGWRRSD